MYLKMVFAWRSNTSKEDFLTTIIITHPTTHNILARPLLGPHTLALGLRLGFWLTSSLTIFKLSSSIQSNG